jgi:ankyrin repeat protein
VLEDNPEAVKLLIEHGADVNKTDTDTWTPLHAACAEGHATIVRYGTRDAWKVRSLDALLEAK